MVEEKNSSNAGLPVTRTVVDEAVRKYRVIRTTAAGLGNIFRDFREPDPGGDSHREAPSSTVLPGPAGIGVPAVRVSFVHRPGRSDRRS